MDPRPYFIIGNWHHPWDLAPNDHPTHPTPKVIQQIVHRGKKYRKLQNLHKVEEKFAFHGLRQQFQTFWKMFRRLRNTEKPMQRKIKIIKWMLLENLNPMPSQIF